jgi:2-C-methyl-D-erythritol 4-phosphate cytidylyltransferase
MQRFAVILPAAGRSTRFGGQSNKLFQKLDGRPVLARTLEAFARRSDVAQIVIATGDAEGVAQCAEYLDASQRAKVKICAGGNCRAESVLCGTRASGEEIEWVAVHDAARPLISQGLIFRVFEAGARYGAAAAALPVHLTVKQAKGPLPARVEKTLVRDHLWAMQTPQAMRRRDLLEAFEKCPLPLEQVTDDVQLMELAGREVWLVEGEERNIKITRPMDLQIAHSILKGQ